MDSNDVSYFVLQWRNVIRPPIVVVFIIIIIVVVVIVVIIIIVVVVIVIVVVVVIVIVVVAFVSKTPTPLFEFEVSFRSRGGMERDDKCQESNDSNEAQHLRKCI